MATLPISPYAVAKLAGEGYCRSFGVVYGLEAVAIRYFNVFGPRQDPRSMYAAVIPNFISALLASESPIIFGDGEQSRDFTYIDNVIDANLLAMDADSVAGHVYNVACGASATLNELVASLNEIVGTSIAPVYRPPRSGCLPCPRGPRLRTRGLLSRGAGTDRRGDSRGSGAAPGSHVECLIGRL
jgi:UDP-glucose 4-epimerase